MSFTFEIKEQNDVSIISIAGKILSDENILDAIQKINKHIEVKNSKLIFNCSKLLHINSTGINFFMKTLTKSRIHNGDLILCGIAGNIESLFKITKLNEIYTIYNSEEDAINHFKK
ncbi:MAG: STAS domain-containing protein [Fluviicola sp.]|jgi:anti-sigma B factor antagonist|nr:STAS domain-containing protein [Fluviicola sp.]